MRVRVLSWFSMLSVPVLLVVGCYKASSYSGDGRLVDNGYSSATDRYVLDLGPLAIANADARTYQLQNLPSDNFVLGIALTCPTSSGCFDDRPINATVSFDLRDDSGMVIVQRQAALGDWTWSVPVTGRNAFIYGRSPQSTYFTPDASSTLQLTVSVLDAESDAATFMPRIIAKTGGWK